jgi:chromosome segregation ATPase
LSYRGSSRGSHSGGKGGLAKEKKLRKKKQEFHSHKLRPFEEEEADLGALKSRTITALNRLGHQTFSTESGGYGLDNWMKSFNMLLDDFQAKVGSETLLGAFRAKREEVTKGLLTPIDSSAIDGQMDEIQRNESELRHRIEEERERVVARQNAIESEKESCLRRLEQERRTLEELNSARQSRGFLSRLVGRSEVPSAPVEAREMELEERIQSLDKETQGLQKIKVSIERQVAPPQGAPHEQIWKDLEALRLKREELNGRKQEMAQRATERDQATAALAEIVSRIPVEEVDTEPTEFAGSQIQ